jgi:PAS domain S-box-containing protein
MGDDLRIATAIPPPLDVQLLLKTLDTSENEILVMDRNGLILWVNSSVERLTGYSASEILGRDRRFLRYAGQMQ